VATEAEEPSVSLRPRTLSRDLTIAIIAGATVAVFTTGAAVAVTTTAVSLTDSTTGKKAHVTNLNSLVTSQRDPYSGAYGRVGATGRALVDTTSGKPWNTGDGVQVNASDGYENIVRLVGAQRVALTSMTLTPTAGSGTIRGQVIVYIGASSAGSCDTLTGTTFNVAERFQVLVNTTEAVHLTWPSGLVYSPYAGTTQLACVSISISSGPASWALDVAANGYLL
jgi:hypothetical protein